MFLLLDILDRICSFYFQTVKAEDFGNQRKPSEDAAQVILQAGRAGKT